MKKSLFRIFIFGFMLLSDLAMFAQLPTEDEDGDLQDEDAPAVKIKKKIIWLAIAGIIYAFYRFKARSKVSLEKPPFEGSRDQNQNLWD